MDGARGIVDWLLNIGEHNPDLACQVIAGLAATIMALVYEWFFMPVAATAEARRRQQGEIYIGTWLLAGTLAALFWWAIDPADALHVRLVVSYVTEMILPAVYFLAARWALTKFPQVASVWAATGAKL